MVFRIRCSLFLLIVLIGSKAEGQTKAGKKPASAKTIRAVRMDTTTWKDLAVGSMSVRDFEELPMWSLKVAPLGLFDPFNRMLTVCGEARPVASNVAYGLEGSVIRNSPFRDEDNPLQVENGFVLRPYCRIYYGKEGKKTVSFLDFAGFYKSLSIRYTDWLNFFPGSPTLNYSQMGTLHINRISYGFMLQAGTLEHSGKGKIRSEIEYFGGIGLRNREIRYASPGEGFEGIGQEAIWPYHTKGWAPTVHVGIRLGFFGLPRF